MNSGLTLQQEVELYLEPLLNLSTDRLQEADITPVDFLYPYTEFIATRFDHALNRFRLLAWAWYTQITDDDGKPVFNTKNLHRKWEDFNLVQTSLMRCAQRLERFVQSTHLYGSRKMTILCEDFKVLLSQCNEFEKEIEFFVQAEVAMKNVVEMQVSNRIATMVFSLTLLAFFFIPVSFGASLFGTDLEVFVDGGKVKSSTFAGVMIAIFLSSWLLLLIGYQIWPRTRKENNIVPKNAELDEAI